MRDYQEMIQKLTHSVMNFSIEFVFEFEEDKKELELQEIPNIELEKLGEIEIREKFNTNIFKIQLSRVTIYDANSQYQRGASNSEVCQFSLFKDKFEVVNPKFEYILKKYIKTQLATDADLEFKEIQFVLFKEAEKNRKEKAILTKTYISEGRFCIQYTCSSASALLIIKEAVKELETDVQKYVRKKMRRDYRHIFKWAIYLFFAFILFLNIQYLEKIPVFISFLLMIIWITVMFYIGEIFDNRIYSWEARKKYEREFFDKITK